MNRNQFHLGNRASPVNRDHVKRPLDHETSRWLLLIHDKFSISLLIYKYSEIIIFFFVQSLYNILSKRDK